MECPEHDGALWLEGPWLEALGYECGFAAFGRTDDEDAEFWNDEGYGAAVEICRGLESQTLKVKIQVVRR